VLVVSIVDVLVGATVVGDAAVLCGEDPAV
jgi:hypothetical protein